MSKKAHKVATVTTGLYIVFIILPNILGLIPGFASALDWFYGSMIIGWIIILTLLGAPLAYFWSYRHLKSKLFLALSLITLLVDISLIIGIAMVAKSLVSI